MFWGKYKKQAFAHYDIADNSYYQVLSSKEAFFTKYDHTFHDSSRAFQTLRFNTNKLQLRI